MKKSLFTLTLFLLGISDALAKSITDNNEPVGHRIFFTENKGQFADQHHKPRTDVLFGGSDGQITFYITKKGISYQMSRAESFREVKDPKTMETRKEINLQSIYRTDITWLHANSDPVITTDEALPDYTNYYLEQCPGGALNVKSYPGITLKNVYDNISLHYYEKQGLLKYDYIIGPHADYKQIQLRVEGAALRLQNDGGLLLETSLGDILEQAPVVYQRNKQLKARYIISNNVISFEVENYDANYELIIDPGVSCVRTWGTYYGATGADLGYSTSTDGSGNVFMCGYTNVSSGTLIATSGAHQTTFAGSGSDSYLVKFTSGGTRLWATYYGGSGDDTGFFTCTDGSGNVYLAGVTTSSTGTAMATGGSYQSAYGGGASDAFLVKFNSAGQRQWGTYYGDAGDDIGYSVCTDISGNVFLGGETSSTLSSAITTSGAHQTTNGGGADAFLVKFNSAGVRQWGTFYGGTGADTGWSCCTDASGNVFIGGYLTTTAGSVISTPGAFQPNFGGSSSPGALDAFLVKFNSSGVRQWGTFYGGNGNERGYSTCTDLSGNIYLSGLTNSSTGTAIATSGAFQSNFGGGFDAYLVKFDGTGARQWATYYGGTGNESGNSICTDTSGNVLMTGYTTASAGGSIASVGAFQANFGGYADAYVVKFDGPGNRMWGTYYGGFGIETGYGICTDLSGDVYVTGSAGSNAVMATSGAFQTSFGGAFLTKFADCNLPDNSGSIAGPAFVCAGNTTNTYSIAVVSGASNYTWSLPGGWSGSSSTNTILITSGSAGILTVVANNTCGVSEQQTLQVTVHQLPVISVNSGSICSGNSFTVLPSGAGTYTIQGGNAVVSPTSTTSYTVVGTSTAGCLSANTVTSNVTVYISPTIVVNSGSVCSGNSFTLTPGGANAYSIQGGSSIVSPGTTTSYTVTGTSTAGCGSANTATANIIVRPLPVINVVTTNTLICAGESVTLSANGASTYTWNTGISGTSIVVLPSMDTTYTVNGTDGHGCSNSGVFTQNVSPCTGLLPTDSIQRFLSFFPNPASDILNVKCGNLGEENKLIITDFIGRELKKTAIRQSMQIEIQELSEGVYFVHLINHGQVIETTKLIVMRQ